MSDENSTTDERSAVPGPSAKVVFLSYATQDAETARDIAEALRAIGIDVWLDRAELAGGDAWDQKIRQQIQTCALFVPVISSNTESRTEGYFRLEWWLAEQRSFRMAKDRPFLFPVVTDLSTTAQAQVPAAFREVQWTRFEGRQVPADFAARVQTLLTGGALRPAPASTSPAVRPQPTLAQDDKSIAVLAFADMSPQKDQEYFSDGLSEELLNWLAKVPQLKVAARTSSFSLKGKDLQISEVGDLLRVAYVLEGSVRKSGDRVRVTAQLIHVADGYHVWAETYDRTLDDIFVIQDEIAAKVVAQLKVTLLGKKPNVEETDARAYALALQARYLDRLGNSERWKQAVALYEQALAIDSSYAAAWTGLAQTYIGQAGKSQRPFQEGYELAREAAGKALAIDPDHAEANALLGKVADAYDGDLTAAARHFERAMTLAPADPEIRIAVAVFAMSLGRLGEAIALLRRTIASDPVNAFAHRSLAIAYYGAGQYDSAIAALRTALTISPDGMGLHGLTGRALLMKGEPELALAAIRQEQSDWTLLELPLVYQALGQFDRSNDVLAQLIAKYPRDAASNIAYIRAYRGEPDEAFIWLDRAVENRDPGLTDIICEPLFSNVHDDPRWQSFLERIGRSPRQLASIKLRFEVPD